MKRRNFLFGLSALGAGVSGATEASTLMRTSATRGIHPRTLFYKYEYDSTFFKVLCFGFGPAGERIVRLASEKGFGNLRCATGDVSGIFQRETKAYDPSIFGLGQDTQGISALLVIDARDPGALADSLFWAAQLAEHAVDLRAALLLNGDASPPGRPWRKAMRASLDGLIEVPCLDDGPSTDDVVLNLLRSIPNLETGLIGHEPLDVREVLATASTACVTLAGWSDESMISAAIGNACAPFEPNRCKGVWALIVAPLDLSLREYDRVEDRLREVVPDEAAVYVGTTIDLDLQEGQGIASLILAKHPNPA